MAAASASSSLASFVLTGECEGVRGILDKDIDSSVGLREIVEHFSVIDNVTHVSTALSFPISDGTARDREPSNYNEICRRVIDPDIILIRCADTLHDFGKTRGNFTPENAKQMRPILRRILVQILKQMESLSLPVPEGRYINIARRFSNLTKQIEFEGGGEKEGMFDKLLPPQNPFIYKNTPESPPFTDSAFTRLELDADDVQDINQANIYRKLIYDFIWPPEATTPTTEATKSFKIMSDASPGDALKNIIINTPGVSEPPVEALIRITFTSIEDSAGTYAVKKKKMSGFVAFEKSLLENKFRPTPVFSLPYIRISTSHYTDPYGRNNPTDFSVNFSSIPSHNLTIDYTGNTSGPGVEYIAKWVMGDTPPPNNKTMDFYNLVISPKYSENAQDVGFVGRDGNLTPLGRLIGLDLKREGDQAQALCVLMSYTAGDRVVLVTSDRMLALFAIKIGCPVIFESGNKIIVYRGEGLNLNETQKIIIEKKRLIEDIKRTIEPFLEKTETDTIIEGLNIPAGADVAATSASSSSGADVAAASASSSSGATDVEIPFFEKIRKYVNKMTKEYSRNTMGLYKASHYILMESLRYLTEGLEQFNIDYHRVLGKKEQIRGIFYTSPVPVPTTPEDINQYLKQIRAELLTDMDPELSNLPSIKSTIDKMSRLHNKLTTSKVQRIDLGKYGFVDLALVKRFNSKLVNIERQIVRGLSELFIKNFEKHTNTVTKPFNELDERLPTNNEHINKIHTLLSTLSIDNITGTLSELKEFSPTVEDAGAGAGAEEASASASASASAEPPDFNQVGTIKTDYEFCVNMIGGLYNAVQPIVMNGKIEQHGNARPAKRSSEDDDDVPASKRRVQDPQELISDVIHTLEIELIEIHDDIAVGIPLPEGNIQHMNHTLILVVTFLKELLKETPNRQISILNTLCEILTNKYSDKIVEHDRNEIFKKFYNIVTIGEGLKNLFNHIWERCGIPHTGAGASPFESIPDYGVSEKLIDLHKLLYPTSQSNREIVADTIHRRRDEFHNTPRKGLTADELLRNMRRAKVDTKKNERRGFARAGTGAGNRKTRRRRIKRRNTRKHRRTSSKHKRQTRKTRK